MQKHYVLQVEGRTIGNLRHSLDEAKVEAERLCKKEKLPVTVWELIHRMTCKIKEIPIEWETIEDEI